MGWFGRKSVPEGRGLVPSFLLGDESGKGFARGYAAQYDEVFRTNPVGQRAVRLGGSWPGSNLCWAIRWGRSHSRSIPIS